MMRKNILFSLLISLFLALALNFGVSSFREPANGIVLSSPSSCPSGGCAAGQRLNIQVEFAVSPKFTGGSNTQVCVFALADGTSGSGSLPWADTSQGWISDKGLISNASYTSGETNNLCTNNTDPGFETITGAYATITTETADQLAFAFNINKSADINGELVIKVFQAKSGGSGWQATEDFSKIIQVTPIASTAYTANTADECGEKTPCFVNSGDDRSNGLGTGLRDAIAALNTNTDLVILGDYVIKGKTVLIDKRLNIRGENEAQITYVGNDCSEPMLAVTAGATISNLDINDGSCASPSRVLILVDSSERVTIRKNTLTYGHRAIQVKDNNGDVIIAFNQIADNLDYAIFRDSGTDSGELSIYANNILDNRAGYQINCNNRGTADHNFWGETVAATSSALNCIVSNGKQLGAPILLETNGAGVQAVHRKVTTNKSYAFNEGIAVQRSSGSDFTVVIVNHGRGDETNIPFLETGSEPIQACSDFYDVFFLGNSVPTNLILSLSYTQDENCVNTIESIDYCQQSNSEKYPLWWYDPANDATDGWDRTGEAPQGTGSSGESGQTTTCQVNRDEISVTIDNTGKPDLASDLNFTPFVVGLPITQGVNLTEFSAIFDETTVDLKWITSSEHQIDGFHILRSTSQSGPYTRITPKIDAIGNTYIGGIYQHTDIDIIFTQTYYYKLEVVDKLGNTIEMHGPLTIITSTATPTITPTRTPTITRTPRPTRTATPYFYRSPTSYYQPYTSTPRPSPTQVRTYGATSTRTSAFNQTLTGTTTAQITGTANLTPSATYDAQDTSYPYPAPSSGPTDSYPPPGDMTATPSEESVTQEMPTPENTETENENNQSNGSDNEDTKDEKQEDPTEPVEKIRWLFLLLGTLSGFGLLGAISTILIKNHLK